MTPRNESDDVAEVYSVIGEQLFKLRSSQLRIIAGWPEVNHDPPQDRKHNENSTVCSVNTREGGFALQRWYYTV